jgi:hypothetical protein
MTQINAIYENAALQTKQRLNTPSAEGFQNSLDMAITRTTGNPRGKEKAALSEPQSSCINQVVAAQTTDVVCQTDRLLELLESYTNGLENPKATIKDLAHLADQLKDGADQLMAATNKDTSTENNLKDIAARTALTAATEYIRFQRGDYI